MVPARGQFRVHSGPIVVDHHFEELEDALHPSSVRHERASDPTLVERGPDWNAMEEIVIRLNPRCASYPGRHGREGAER